MIIYEKCQVLKDLVVSKVCGGRHSLWPLLFNLWIVSRQRKLSSVDGLQVWQRNNCWALPRPLKTWHLAQSEGCSFQVACLDKGQVKNSLSPVFTSGKESGSDYNVIFKQAFLFP